LRIKTISRSPIPTKSHTKFKNSSWSHSENTSPTPTVSIFFISDKYVKIYGWDFEIELDLNERKCSRIILNADHIVFIQNKNNKYELKDIAFRTVVATADTVEEFSK
jgi:hypothetical protein